MKIDSDHPLLLASASPRRRALLLQVGVPIEVRSVEVDEDLRPGEEAEAYLARVVEDKRQRAVELWRSDPELCQRCPALLVADTAVVHGRTVLGKPRDDDDARRMLAALAGDQHRVSTRVAIAAADGGGAPLWTDTVTTVVTFRPLDEAQIAAYLATGEGRDKAGSYGIQGIGAMLVRRIEGSYSNVVGLPICAVVDALQRAGLLSTCPVATGGDEP